MKGLSTGDMTEIRRMFEEVVSHSTLRVQAVTQFPSRQPPKNKKELNTENVSIPLAREMPELQQKLENEVEEIEPVEELDFGFFMNLLHFSFYQSPRFKADLFFP